MDCHYKSKRAGHIKPKIFYIGLHSVAFFAVAVALLALLSLVYQKTSGSVIL